MEEIKIPIVVIDTLYPEGYAERFWHFVQASGLNHREAWEALENERAEYRIPERFSSYESFKAHSPNIIRNKESK